MRSLICFNHPNCAYIQRPFNKDKSTCWRLCALVRINCRVQQMDGCKEHNVKQSKPDRKTNMNFFFYTKSIFRSDRVIEGHEQERGREQERVAAQRIPSVRMTNGRDGPWVPSVRMTNSGSRERWTLGAKQHSYYGGDQLISDRIKAPYTEENTRVVLEILSSPEMSLQQYSAK